MKKGRRSIRRRLPRFSEKQIQLAFFLAKGNGFRLICPNIRLRFGEADLITVSPSGYLEEFEIKVSRGDFKADLKKERKHYFFHNTEKIPSTKQVPNKFWYLLPEQLVSLEEIPEYAGLISIDKSGDFIVKKQAPFLHKDKHDISVKIARSFMFRYFNQLVKRRNEL